MENHITCARDKVQKSTVTVMSDARHGWRKNVQDTSVVILGKKSHQALVHEHVTKQDDPITQRHYA